MILGIDHGYYAIKTRNCSFPAGITPFGDREPYTRQNVLTFGGYFFVCASGRQPIQRDKTVNDNYYLLTLAAIAKEIEARGAPRECSVTIAAGLPLTGHGREKPASASTCSAMQTNRLSSATKAKSITLPLKMCCCFPRASRRLWPSPTC